MRISWLPYPDQLALWALARLKSVLVFIVKLKMKIFFLIENETYFNFLTCFSFSIQNELGKQMNFAYWTEKNWNATSWLKS